MFVCVYIYMYLSELRGPPHDGDLELLERGTDNPLDIVRQNAVLHVQIALVDVDSVVHLSTILTRTDHIARVNRHKQRPDIYNMIYTRFIYTHLDQTKRNPVCNTPGTLHILCTYQTTTMEQFEQDQ